MEKLAAAEEAHHHDVLHLLHLLYAFVHSAIYTPDRGFQVRIFADDLGQFRGVDVSSQSDVARKLLCQKSDMDARVFTGHVEGSDKNCYTDRSGARHDS